MKKNVIIIFIVLALLAISLILLMQNKQGTLRSDIGGFAIDDTATVTKIFMADRQGNEVLLKEQVPGHWILNDSLIARREGVELLLSTMARLAVKAPVSKSIYNTVIKRLASSSVKVEIYQMTPRINIFNWIKLFPHEKRTRVYYVGSATPDNMGSFMLMEDSDTPFVVYLPGFRGYVSARFTAYVSDWRDHTIFAKKPAQIKTIQVEFPGESFESFRIDKFGDSDLKLQQLSNAHIYDGFDTSRVIDFINAFRNIRFEESFQNIDFGHKDSIVAQTPVNIITLIDTEGNTQKVSTYRRQNIDGQKDLEGNFQPWDVDRLYAVNEDSDELLLVQYFVFDPITRPLSFLLGEYKGE